MRSGAKLLWRAGTHDTLELARIAAAPVIRLTQEWFGGEHGKLLVSGNAMHADVPMEAPGSGLFGWLLVMLAQDVGFPVPQGGAGMLSQAMANRARAAGARIDVGENVTDVVVRGGRAQPYAQLRAGRSRCAGPFSPMSTHRACSTISSGKSTFRPACAPT